jgi:hypothetical protein
MRLLSSDDSNDISRDCFLMVNTRVLPPLSPRSPGRLGEASAMVGSNAAMMARIVKIRFMISSVI